MRVLRLLLLASVGLSSPALAQWGTSDHTIPIGRGVGKTGFKELGPCGTGIPIIGVTAADPVCGGESIGSLLSMGTGTVVKSAAGTYVNRTLVPPTEGFTISNANGVGGSPTFALANDLGALEALSTTGYARRTGTSTWDTRSASQILDDIGSTRGSILFRGAAGWSALTPGTSGFALVSSGAGADPVYSAVGTGTVSSAVIAGTTGNIAVSGTCTITTTGTCTVDLAAARKTGMTTQSFLSSSGTYTTPANVIRIEGKLIGGGGGGGPTNAITTNGGAGGASCWNTTGAACSSPVYSAGGGSGGSQSATVMGGGSVTGSGSCILAVDGGTGGGTGDSTPRGGAGGVSTLGGSGAGAGLNSNGGGASPNSGSGGGGGAQASQTAGQGGGSGATCDFVINSPAASYTYVVGAGGAGGTGSGFAGGAGAAGRILIKEYYNFLLRRDLPSAANDNRPLFIDIAA